MVLAEDVGNLTEEQVIQQFDATLIKFHHRLIEEIHKEELAGYAMSLQRRWNFVSSQLKLNQYLGHIRDEHEKFDTKQFSAVTAQPKGKSKGSSGASKSRYTHRGSSGDEGKNLSDKGSRSSTPSRDGYSSQSSYGKRNPRKKSIEIGHEYNSILDDYYELRVAPESSDTEA